MINHRYAPGLAFGVGASIVSAVLVVLFDDGILGNDFAQMVSVARNLISGSGLQTDLIYYDVHYAMLAPNVPQTVFPPGQSLLVAPMMVLGASSYTAALTWSLIALLVSGLLLTLTVRQLGAKDATVIVVLVAWLVLGINWTNVLASRSESLFTVMTVVGLHSFVRWVHGGYESRVLLILLGAGAAFAFLFRYQGLFFIAAVGLYFFARALKGKGRGTFLDLVAVLALPGIVVVATWVYNASVTGSIGGGPVDHTQHSASILPVALGYYYEISKILGISREGLVRGGGSEMFAIALVAYIVFVSSRIARQHPFWESDSQSRAFLFCASYICISVVAFAFLSLTKSTGYTQARYLSTLLPFAITVLALLSHQLRRLSRLRPWQGALGLAIVIGFIGFGQARAISEQLDGLAADSRLREIRAALDTSYGDGQSIGHLLRSEIDAGNNLLANQSQLVGHVLERPTLGLTPALFTARDFSFDEVQRMAELHSIRYVILFPTMYDPTAPQNRNRIILTELANRNIPDWIAPVFEAPDVRLYRIE